MSHLKGKIEITPSVADTYCFDVEYDGRKAMRLTFEETLGLFTQLIMPQSTHERRCLQWLQTPEQIAKYEKRMAAFTDADADAAIRDVLDNSHNPGRCIPQGISDAELERNSWNDHFESVALDGKAGAEERDAKGGE